MLDLLYQIAAASTSNGADDYELMAETPLWSRARSPHMPKVFPQSRHPVAVARPISN